MSVFKVKSCERPSSTMLIQFPTIRIALFRYSASSYYCNWINADDYCHHRQVFASEFSRIILASEEVKLKCFHLKLFWVEIMTSLRVLRCSLNRCWDCPRFLRGSGTYGACMIALKTRRTHNNNEVFISLRTWSYFGCVGKNARRFWNNDFF